ncbi:hypothetical protein CK218_21080 [Mesorhizobium sp. WSM3879]|nr:hypothetical protein CK218_21080 [Mesorhizobium sp. WSM3879]
MPIPFNVGPGERYTCLGTLPAFARLIWEANHMLDRPPAENPGRTLAIVLAVGLIIIALFFIGFRYSERDQGALIVPGTVQGSK